jgi:excisionase family DNA binding protein
MFGKMGGEEKLNKLLTVKEAADFLQITENTIYLWARNGKLPCIRFGSSIRFDPEELKKGVRRGEEF